jgi:integrase
VVNSHPSGRAACAHASITPAVGFHILRHTWASLAVMVGVPLTVVARNLGHVNTGMVEKHYGHLSVSYVTEAIRAHRATVPNQPTALSRCDSVATSVLLLAVGRVVMIR